MIQLTIEIRPETAQYIQAMLPMYPGLAIEQLAGKLLDKQLAYRLEVEHMKPATVEIDHPFGGGY